MEFVAFCEEMLGIKLYLYQYNCLDAKKIINVRRHTGIAQQRTLMNILREINIIKY